MSESGFGTHSCDFDDGTALSALLLQELAYLGEAVGVLDVRGVDRAEDDPLHARLHESVERFGDAFRTADEDVVRKRSRRRLLPRRGFGSPRQHETAPRQRGV